MKTRPDLPKRRAVSGIIAALFLFAMIFTTGAGYFLFVTNQNKNFVTALNGVQSSYRQKTMEDAVVTPPSSQGSTVRVVVRNAGASVLNITSIVLDDASGSFIQYYGKYNPSVSGGGPVPTCTQSNPSPPCNTSPNLPIYVAPGSSSPIIDTLYQGANGVEYTVQVLTSDGNVFTGGYPFPVGQNVLLSQLSQGVGSFVIIASSMRFYYATGQPTGDGFEVGGFYSNVIPGNTKILFTVQMQNVDPFGRAITLNQRSLLTAGGVPASGQLWYLVQTIQQNTNCGQCPYVDGTAYTHPVTVPYEGSDTLYFGANSPGGTCSTGSPGNGCVNSESSNSPLGTFLLLYGSYDNGSPFAQTVPFAATLVSGATDACYSGCSSGQPEGNQGASVTLSLTGFTSPPQAYWVNPDSSTQVVTTTTSTSQVKFTIPSTAQHSTYYAVAIDDGVEAVSIEVLVN